MRAHGEHLHNDTMMHKTANTKHTHADKHGATETAASRRNPFLPPTKALHISLLPGGSTASGASVSRCYVLEAPEAVLRQ